MTLKSGVDAHGPAHSGRSLGAQHGRARYHPRGPCGASRSRRDNACSLAWAGTSRAPAFASAAESALRNGTTAAATVMGIKYIGASVSRNNQPSASHQFPATTSLFHITFPTIFLTNPSTAQFLSKPFDRLPQHWGMAAPWSQCKDSWASSPKHFHECVEQFACRTAKKFRAEVQREDEQKWEWVIPKKDEARSTSAKSAGSDDKRSVLPKSSAAKRQRYEIGSHGNPLHGCSHSGWTRYDLHDDDGGHPDVSPGSAAAAALHPTEILDGTPETSAPHSPSSGPDS